MKAFLTTPSLQWRDSFEQAVREAPIEEQNYEFGTPWDISPLVYGIDRYILEMPWYADGSSLPSWRVPQTIWWLIVDNQFVGQIKRRHELNAYLTTFWWEVGYVIAPARRRQGRWTKMLTLACEKRKAEGVDKLLITCNKKNIWSQKIIEAHGGVFTSSIRSDEEQDVKLRYWVYL
jgi:predicted acetyltransferase